MTRAQLVLSAAAISVLAAAGGYGLAQLGRPPAPTAATAASSDRKVLYWFLDMVMGIELFMD